MSGAIGSHDLDVSGAENVSGLAKSRVLSHESIAFAETLTRARMAGKKQRRVIKTFIAS